ARRRRRRGPDRAAVAEGARREDDRDGGLGREGEARQGARRHPRRQLLDRELRAAREGDHQRQRRAGRLRRRRQVDLGRLARLPAAARPDRLVRQRLGAGAAGQPRHPLDQGLALRHAADAKHAHREPRRPGKPLQGALRGGQGEEGEDRDHAALQARRRGAGASRPRGQEDHGIGDPRTLTEPLTAELLRRHFATAPPLESSIYGDERDERPRPDAPDVKPAAVLVPILAHPEALTLLLTKRAAHLKFHPGQVSFPGGRVDAGDSGPEETALREAREEIGLARERVELIGRLPNYLTGTNYRITPVVGLLTP